MNAQELHSDHFLMTLGLVVFLIFPIGCGAVGPPIAPEDIGIEAKIRSQQKENAKSPDIPSEDPAASVEEESVELPAFYPIGTR